MKLCRVCTYSYSSKYVNLQGGISQKVNFIKVTELLGTLPHYTESPLLFIILALNKANMDVSKMPCFIYLLVFLCFVFFFAVSVVLQLGWSFGELSSVCYYTHTHTHRPHKYTLFLSVLNCR